MKKICKNCGAEYEDSAGEFCSRNFVLEIVQVNSWINSKIGLMMRQKAILVTPKI